MLSNDLLPFSNFNAGSDKSFKQWKCIWYWPFTLSDALCFALREGKPCSIDATFQQTSFLVCQVQTRGKISKPAFLFCMLWCFIKAANMLKLLCSLLVARWFTGFEKLAIMVWQLVQLGLISELGIFLEIEIFWILLVTWLVHWRLVRNTSLSACRCG